MNTKTRSQVFLLVGIVLLLVVGGTVWALWPHKPAEKEIIHPGQGQMETFTMEGLCEASDQIVYGTVIERQASYMRNDFYFTPVVVQVKEVLKGDSTIQSLTFEELYGETEDKIYIYDPDSYQPVPAAMGMDIIVFVNSTGGTPGGGICEVKDGQVYINRFIDHPAAQREDNRVPLAEFEELVRGYVEG